MVEMRITGRTIAHIPAHTRTYREVSTVEIVGDDITLSKCIELRMLFCRNVILSDTKWKWVYIHLLNRMLVVIACISICAMRFVCFVESYKYSMWILTRMYDW